MEQEVDRLGGWRTFAAAAVVLLAVGLVALPVAVSAGALHAGAAFEAVAGAAVLIVVAVKAITFVGTLAAAAAGGIARLL